MSRLAIVIQLKEKKFVSGNLICDLPWSSVNKNDEMKVYSFIRATRINSLRKKKRFKRLIKMSSAQYVTFAVYLKRTGIVITKENSTKIKKFLGARQMWINWTEHVERKEVHSEESWAV